MAAGRGIKFPITRGNTGYFNQTFTTLDQARTNVMNLLLTNKGERVMQPDFGADIYKYLFENITASTGSEIDRKIRDAIAFWLPYIRINSLDIDLNDVNIDQNRIRLTLSYGLVNLPNINDVITLDIVA